MTLSEHAARFVRNRRRRQRVLAISAIASLVGASVTLAAVERPGPIVLMLFLLVAQPAIGVAACSSPRGVRIGRLRLQFTRRFASERRQGRVAG